jgi:hypothetical protein
MPPQNPISRIVFPLLISGLVVGGLSGCGPTIKTAYRDPSFTKTSLAARGLAIGGMTSITVLPSERLAARTVLDTLLWVRLSTELKGVPLEPLAYARRSLGKDDRERLLSAYEQRGAISKECADLLEGACSDSAPFLLFGRVDDDRVKLDRTSDPVADKTYNLTIRWLGCGFEVYDCRLRKSVWKSHMVLRRSTGKEAKEDPPLTIGNVIESIFFPDNEPEYKPPPEMQKMLWALFGGVPSALTEK